MNAIRSLWYLVLLLIGAFATNLRADTSSNQMSYQAIVRNASNDLLRNSTVDVRFSLLKGAELVPVYVETHRAVTNENGLISVQIGAGTVEKGTNLSAIDWDNDDYQLKVEMDPTGKKNYSLTAITPLLSVPYAMYSQKAGQLTQSISYNDLTDKPVLFSGNYADLQNLPSYSLADSIARYGFSGDYADLTNKPKGESDGDILYWDASQGNWVTLPLGLEGQFLSVANGKMTWVDPSFANTSANTYKVGDLYYKEGVPYGIVFEVSNVGRYGKIMALEDVASVAWDPKGTAEIWEADDPTKFPLQLNAVNQVDGADNMSTINHQSGWITAYPAFAACANMGDGWYLPAQNELMALYSLRESIASKLASVNGEPMTKNEYWSSTEKNRFFSMATAFNSFEMSIPGSTEIINIAAGDTYESMKGDSLGIRPVKLLNWQELTSKPDASEFHQVGEIIKENEVEVGVVYAVSDGGLHGKILSLQEDSAVWTSSSVTPVLVNCSNTEDGRENVNETISSNLSSYPAFNLAYNKGEGWYLPAISELLEINNQQVAINNLLPANVVPIQGSYWSSTESSVEKAQSLTVGGSATDTSKQSKLKVRLLKSF